MIITGRDVTKEELNGIYDDFKRIEAKYGIEDASAKRYNITVEDNNVYGF